MQIEDGWRKPSEKRPDAVQRGHFREVEAASQNPDAEAVAACEAAKPALIVYGKRVGTILTVCTDNQCPIHDPRAAARRAAEEAEQAENPAPVMAPAPPAETDEEAETRKQQHEQQRKEYEAEQERRAETSRLEREREEKEEEAEQTRRDEQRKTRAATFERILENAPATLTAAQLRVLLRAIVNLDPYTFADDLAEELTADNDNERRSAEEVLLAVINTTADDKLTRFAIRLALSAHVRIPRENEIDLLPEAEAAFLMPRTSKTKPKKEQAVKKPTLVKPTKTAAKKAKAKTNTPAAGKNAVAA